ncbi:armadillo-type protein [Mycena haematopus]|nr:armadillo-type protein [Mycena haematopus]
MAHEAHEATSFETESSEMCARLCRKMMEQISPKVHDDGIRNAEGKPIAGGQLLRKYLLNRCQDDFERGWVAKDATAVAAAVSKVMEDKVTKAINEQSREASAAGERGDEFDEYYAAHKAKRQWLGLIKFIGEIFKVQMLTERIMHECVKKLLGNVENPEDEEIEGLCVLLSTIGSLLDTQKARAHMDVYFSRMKELGKSSKVSSRTRFMLQDVIELRDRKWVARTQAVPTAIRGPSGGWANISSDIRNALRPPPKTRDFSNFGKIAASKGLPMTFGPSSVFSGKKDNSKRESLSRASSNSNMFSMLSQTPDDAAEAGPKPAAEPAQRRRLILQPRKKPAEDQGIATAKATPAGCDNSESEEEEAALEMAKEDADKKIAEDAKEFFAVRNLDEAEVYFSALPAVHHCRLVEKLVGTAVEGKKALAQLVTEFLTRVVSKELCSAEALEEGFVPLVEILGDIAIDAPKAPNNMAPMMKAVFDSDQAARIAAKSTEPDNLAALLSYRLW